MKKYFLLCLVIVLYLNGYTQITIGSGANWINSGTIRLNIQDLDLLNSGNFNAANSLIKFSGNSDNTIGGSSIINFYDLEIAKSGSKQVLLQSSINLDNHLNFTSGLLNLNQKNLLLAAAALLTNENEASRITGVNGGEVIISLNMNAPNNSNPGNLGCVLTSTANLGLVVIKRGHKMQSGTGLASSVNRYFNIQPANNTNLNASLRFTYFDAELNSQSENTLELYKSDDGGSHWNAQTITGHDAALNYVEKSNLNSLSLWTASSAVNSPLPITGLVFSAKRRNPEQVLLSWKTIQEINNLGFYIERKKEDETDFKIVGFVPSDAINGNSNNPLEYEKTDTINYRGRIYYRLRQTDLDGHFSYSETKMINGDNEKQITMKVWPVPAVREFSILINGPGKSETVQIFDITGKLVKSVILSDNTTEKVNGLVPGTYILKLLSNQTISQKIIIQ